MTVSPAKAKKGDTVTIDAAGSYYVHISYSGKTVTIQTTGNNPATATFTMPGNNVSITAGPTP